MEVNAYGQPYPLFFDAFPKSIPVNKGQLIQVPEGVQ